MQSKNRKSRRHVVGGFDALETRTLLSVLINTQPTVNVELMPPRVRGWHGRGVAIIQPTDITVSGTAQPPAANVAIEIEVYGLDANGQVLNSGNPLAVTTTNFLGRYQTTFSLPSTMRKDMNSIIVRERAVGFIDGTQVIDPTTLTNLTGNLAIDATTISNLEASLSLQPGTLSNLQGNIRINGWDGDLDGTVGPTLASGEFVGTFEGEVDIDVIGVGETAGEVESDGPVELDIEEADVDGTVTNPDLSGGLSDGTADESARQGSISDGTGNIAATTGTFTQTGAANIAATTGTVRLRITEYAVSEAVEIYIHQTRGNLRPARIQPTRVPLAPRVRPERMAPQRPERTQPLRVEMTPVRTRLQPIARPRLTRD